MVTVAGAAGTMAATLAGAKERAAAAAVDSCHSRHIRNQQNLYPKFLLLSYLSYFNIVVLGSNSAMGFLRTNDLQ